MHFLSAFLLNISFIKILLIGNSISYYNGMPNRLEEKLDSACINYCIEESFKPGCNLQALISSMFYSSESINSNRIDESYKVWKSTNNKYQDFVTYFGSFDIIYIQSQGLNKTEIYEIIHIIDQISNKDAIILLFQNYSYVTWNEQIRKKELESNLAVFKKYCKSSKVRLIEVGNKFDKILSTSSHVKLIDSSNHPTKIGSEIISEAIFEEILNYLKITR